MLQQRARSGQAYSARCLKPHAQDRRKRRARGPAARKGRNPAIASALMDGFTPAGADPFAFIGTLLFDSSAGAEQF